MNHIMHINIDSNLAGSLFWEISKIPSELVLASPSGTSAAT